VGDEARRAGGGAAAASGAGGWGSCETYGGCLQRGSFRHIATVALMLDVLEPIDIYKKQLQTRDQTHAQDMAQYHACRAPLNCINVPNEVFENILFPMLGKVYEKCIMPKQSRHQDEKYHEYIYVWKK
jgi:hypothetical protein